MVLDLNLIRTDRGGNPEIVKDSEIKRGRNGSVIDSILDLDKKWRSERFKLDNLKKYKNLSSKRYGDIKKNNSVLGGDQNDSINCATITYEDLTDELIRKLNETQLKDVSNKIGDFVVETEEGLKEIELERNKLWFEVGNLVHDTVVVSNDEDNNKVERTYGNITMEAQYSHVDLVEMIDGADFEKGVMISGSRGYFLKGPLVFLSQALIQLSLRLLYEKGYQPLYTPFFMNKEIMHEVAQLSQFDEELYKVISKSEVKGDSSTEEKYLIATSEQTIAAYHRNEWLDPSLLPLYYAGISSCFRQEVGSHGRDTTGIFRVHQFEKVEQFVICSPYDNKSWELFDFMIGNSEELCKILGLPYRIVSIVSGALNNAASKKFDLEAWFPGSKAFRELVSCSNCTDYQSRRLGIRYGQTKKMNQEVEFVHMLNCTMCAVTRVICCILEVHQTESGINIPEVLHPYLPSSLKFIKFVNKTA